MELLTKPPYGMSHKSTAEINGLINRKQNGTFQLIKKLPTMKII